MNVEVASHSTFVFVVWFQCQKFGQFNKEDPNSFRLSESLSLYPQVKPLQLNSDICDRTGPLKSLLFSLIKILKSSVS